MNLGISKFVIVIHQSLKELKLLTKFRSSCLWFPFPTNDLTCKSIRKVSLFTVRNYHVMALQLVQLQPTFPALRSSKSAFSIFSALNQSRTHLFSKRCVWRKRSNQPRLRKQSAIKKLHHIWFTTPVLQRFGWLMDCCTSMHSAVLSCDPTLARENDGALALNALRINEAYIITAIAL